VEEAIRSSPVGKSPGADNIPAELLKHGGETVITHVTCSYLSEDLGDKTVANRMDTITHHTSAQEGEFTPMPKL